MDLLRRKNTEEEREVLTACRNGGLEKVKRSQVDLKTLRDHEWFECGPLHYAAGGGHIAIVQFLLENGKASVNVKDRDGDTPLHTACRHGHLSVVRYLLHDVHCDPEVQDSSGQTPLHCACGWGHITIVQFLLESGKASVNVKDRDDDTPLHTACGNGHLPVVRYLLNNVHSHPEVKSSNGQTPLHYACRWAHTSVVQFLLESGKASVNVKDRNGDTPLHKACGSIREDITDLVEFLLTKGDSDPNCANNKGETPLALSDKPDVHRLLLKHGAEPTQVYKRSQFLPGNSERSAAQPTIPVFMIRNKGAEKTTLTKALIADSKGLSCLTARLTKNTEEEREVLAACKNGSLKKVKRSQVDFKTLRDRGWFECSPLHYAAGNGHLPVVRYLLDDVHCDPEVEDSLGQTPLHHASQWGHISVVQVLLESGKASVNVKDRDGETPLHTACRWGHTSVVQLFLESGKAIVDVEGRDGDTPLHKACREGNVSVVQVLLESGKASVDVRDKDGDTPLHKACMWGHISVVQFLLESGKASADVKEIYGDTPLHMACRRRDISVMQVLLKSGKASCDVKDKDGDTPLHIACRKGDTSVVQFLLKSGKASVDVMDRDGDTPLHIACREGNISLVHVLLESGKASVDVKNRVGDTPLHMACGMGHTPVVQFLLGNGKASVNVKDRNGVTPLHTASRQGHTPVVQLFLESGKANVDVQDRDGDTPLHKACRRRHISVVQVLLESGKARKVDVRNRHGDTPLHIAFRQKCTSVVRFLLESEKVSVDVKDRDGDTFLHKACMEGYTSVVQVFLESEKANVNVKNRDGDIPLHIACRRGKRKMVELLLTNGCSDPNCPNNTGRTPLAAARDTDVIRLLLKHGAEPTQVYQCSQFLPGNSKRAAAQPTVTVFMIGNRGAGKTTLTKALITESKGLSRLTARWTKVEGVKERTAGIECHQIHSPRIGSLTIYDLAGHREFHSSHDTVIRSASSGAIFLFVIDLTATDEELQQTVFFWLASIQNQVSSSSSDIAKMCLLLIGSHADQLPSKAEIKRKQNVIEHACKSVSKVQVVGFVAANCQYSESSALTQVREHIFSIQETLQENMAVTFPLHCFHIYLITVCGDQPGVLLGTVMRHIEQEVREHSSRVWSYSVFEGKPPHYIEFLPQNLQALCEMCVELNRRGIILYLQKEHVENSWVIIEKDLLLKNVNGTVFAPQDFQEYKSLAIHTGVVPFSKVRDCFKEKKETKDIDTELIIQFMIHMEFCGEVLDKRMLKLLAIKYPYHKNERHFLFPNLITENKEKVESANSGHSVWQPNPHITYSPYSLCWVLQCHGEQYYLSPRFLQVLLLRLAFQHALPAYPRKTASAIPGLKQACILWQSGIKWSTTSLTEVLVEVSDHQVVVIMRCKEGKEIALVRTRSQVIKEVLLVKKKFCSNTETVEMFIPNPQYPLKYDLSVPVENVVHSVARHEEAAHASDLVHTPVELEKLLCFEPYMCLSSECLISLYSPDSPSDSVTPQFIDHAARAIAQCHDFCKVFNDFCTVLHVLPHEISVNGSSSAYSKVKKMFLVWKEKTEGTYKSLRDCLDIYSVFSRRNILEMARIPLTDSASKTKMRLGEEKKPTSGERKSTTTQSKLDSKPTIQELQTLHHRKGTVRIIESIAPNWESLGIALDFGMPIIETIRRATHYQPEDGCREILARWLRGEGATWNNLLQAMDDIKEHRLASDLRNVLQ